MVKIRRHSCYERLRRVGFLPFEAQVLSRVPSYVPYLKAMVKERRDMARKAQSLGTTQRKFEEQIRELYKVNKWLKLNRVGKVVADPWKMIRDFGDRWRQKYPQYDSPWEKRYKNMKDFMSRIEKTLAREKLRA